MIKNCSAPSARPSEGVLEPIRSRGGDDLQVWFAVSDAMWSIIVDSSTYRARDELRAIVTLLGWGDELEAVGGVDQCMYSDRLVALAGVVDRSPTVVVLALLCDAVFGLEARLEIADRQERTACELGPPTMRVFLRGPADRLAALDLDQARVIIRSVIPAHMMDELHLENS